MLKIGWMDRWDAERQSQMLGHCFIFDTWWVIEHSPKEVIQRKACAYCSRSFEELGRKWATWPEQPLDLLILCQISGNILYW